jgi:hypothetical protein
LRFNQAGFRIAAQLFRGLLVKGAAGFLERSGHLPQLFNGSEIQALVEQLKGGPKSQT